MEYTKVCFKCEIEQPITEFYKHSQMEDGHINKCKTCTRKDTRERVEILRKNPEWVEKEKKRGREKYHRLYSNNSDKNLDSEYNVIFMEKEEYIKHSKIVKQQWNILNRDKKRISNNLYKNKYPEKYIARNKSQRLPCKKGNQLHHWSYNEEHYKDVIELSVSDHALLHRNMIYDQERMMYRNINGILLDTKESHIELLNKLKQQN